MNEALGLAVALLAAAMLSSACTDDSGDACHCWCDCGDGKVELDADSSSECTDMCNATCGANVVENFYECAD